MTSPSKAVSSLYYGDPSPILRVDLWIGHRHSTASPSPNSQTQSLHIVQAGIEFTIQSGFKLAGTHLAQPPQCWDDRHVPLHPAGIVV